MESTASIAAIATNFVNNTAKNVFLTGKAGTGKTTFLKEIYQNTYKQAVIAAPTGIAAINAGGSTLHSLFQLPFGGFIPEHFSNAQFTTNSKIHTPSSLLTEFKMHEKKHKVLREMELLIIDEVSMLRADLLDAIDVILRHVRRKKDLTFGGVQVLFIGDLLQLPPVVNETEWNILKKHYETPYFFNAQVLRENPPIFLELDKIYRQGDKQFIDLLNNLRNNSISREDTQLLNTFYKPDFIPEVTEKYIRLTTHNYQSDQLNRDELNKLTARSHFFNAIIDGVFAENNYPIDAELELKTGAQVMFVKNDVTGAQRYFNGKIGVISSISDKKITVEFNDGTEPVLVDRYTWENKRYELNEISGEIEEEIIGTFEQYPIKLAWAITIHKSQGLTFERAIIDVGKAFAPGQVYVALSRLTSLNGLVLSSQVNFESLAIDKHIKAFNSSKPKPSDITSIFESASEAFFKEYVLHSFNFSDLLYHYKKHIDSYTKDKKKALKNKYDGWAQGLFLTFMEEKAVADKFLTQLERIFSRERNIPYLNQRLDAAISHFETSLEKLIEQLYTQREQLEKNEKRAKKYIEEVNSLASQTSKQLKKMQKSALLVQSLEE